MPKYNPTTSGNPYVTAFHDLMATSKDFAKFLADPAERQGIRQGFTDAVNRGAVAATLGAPVDMANTALNLGKAAVGYLGNKAGVLSADQMPQLIDNPVGGSEYIGNQMRRLGVVSPNRNALAESIAGFLPVSPSTSGKAVAAIAGGGVVPGLDLAATVFHGSPHKFDRFDSSKIGTGEGAQAYGHGLYLAESPKVAQSYKDALTPNTGTWDATINGQSLFDAAANHGTTGYASAFAQKYFDLVKGGKSDKQARQQLLSQLQKRIAAAKTPGDAQGSQEALQFLQNAKINMPEGSLYKVDLPDEAIAKMLDWDKPLSQQAPEVRAALTPEALGLRYEKLPNGNHAFVNEQGTRVGNMQKGGTPDSFRANWLDSVANSGLSGREVYQSINDGMFGKDKAAAALRQAGIPGIRYLDAGSRGQGQGTSNYVVFPGEENMLRILERNGQPMPAPANALSAKREYVEPSTPTGATMQVGGREVPVTMYPSEAKQGNKIVNVDPAAFDKQFAKNENFYVGKGGEGGIGNRYNKFLDWIKDAPSMNASNVSVSGNGSVMFGNGRHRYAGLRDMGVSSIPVSMDAESIANAKKFGLLAK